MTSKDQRTDQESSYKNALTTLEPVQQLSHLKLALNIDESAANDKIDQFNQCAQRLSSEALPSPPFNQAGAIHRTIKEVELIIKNAENAIETKLAQLQADLTGFTSDVAFYSNPKWYRKVEDLTANEYVQFSELLDRIRIADVADFCDYLKSSLPLAAVAEIPENESRSRGFVGKVHMLIGKVIRESRYEIRPAVLSLLVVVKASVLLDGKGRGRVREALLREEHAYIDDMIFWLLGQFSEDDVSNLFWDFAQNWRVLINAREKIPAEPGTLICLLEPLKEKARLEIRHRTYLAVNGRLPNELADTIFEYAMLAEEVPLEA